jgi:hypothetical protein
MLPREQFWQGVLDTILSDNHSLSVTLGRSVVFSPVSSTNKTDCHNMTELLMKVALSTITKPNQPTTEL